MAARRRLLAVLVTVVFAGAPAAACAQSTTGSDAPDLSQTPPVQLDPPSSSSTTGTSGAASANPVRSGALPNTGTDARVIALLGAALLAAGLGLRLRARDARF